MSNEINHLITPESVYDTKSCYQLILSKTNNKMRESQYWNNGTMFLHRPKHNHLSDTFSATVSFSLLSRLSKVFNRLSKCGQKISEYESLDQFISYIFLFKLTSDSLLTF